MHAPDEIKHLKQAQARQGLAIGGIKSCLHGMRATDDAIERRVRNVETLAYALAVFIAVFYSVIMLSLNL